MRNPKKIENRREFLEDLRKFSKKAFFLEMPFSEGGVAGVSRSSIIFRGVESLLEVRVTPF